jgi:hypothetical protein
VVGEAATDVILAAVAQEAPRTMRLVRDAVPTRRLRHHSFVFLERNLGVMVAWDCGR